MSKNWLYPFFTPIHSRKGKRVYVSGPMTGFDDYNYPAFHAAAAALREMGYAVCNPAETDNALATIDPNNRYTTFLRFDAERVLEADFLVALPQWERSRGAQWEILTAIRIGTAVWGWENWKDYDRITEARVFAAIADLYSGATITVNKEAAIRAGIEAMDEARVTDYESEGGSLGKDDTVLEIGSLALSYGGDDSVVREGARCLELESEC